MSKRQVVSKINKHSMEMIRLGDEGEYEWYVTRMNKGAAYDSIKKMMSQHGWEFQEQMGAGFKFGKGNKSIIGTTQMWTRKYVLYKVPAYWNQ
ncbi:hypothetical protein [Bacillus sp. Marseille-P3661]|uniref:hypothetical protein n=1 Tax=Bacillus sp. Marseille-P3661 TaxID=1936234 RepID=UPI0015E17DB4|nr:hypothetical protein [Bacillus sp. Marseille-P3661]